MYFRIHINISETTAAENSIHRVHCTERNHKSVISTPAGKWHLCVSYITAGLL